MKKKRVGELRAGLLQAPQTSNATTNVAIDPRALTPPGTLLLLSITGYIFSLQWSGAVGCSLCLLHATFRPPVARAVRGATSRGPDGIGSNPELHGGDGDLEGGGGVGSGGGNGRGRVNANMRLRTRPTAGGMTGGGGMSPVPMGGGAFHDTRSSGPMVDPMAATRGRPHAHGS